MILAAGRGTRMRSDLPKALHRVAGVPMVLSLLKAAKTLRPERVVVVAGYRFGDVKAALDGHATVVEQKPLLGSGHAVAAATKALKNFKGSVAVLYCDTPLLAGPTLETLVRGHREGSTACTLLSVELDRPTGYGRILRASDGSVARIVEENDATAAQKAIREINVGCYVFDGPKLFAALSQVQRNPKKKEYYLTDAIEILAREGRVEAVVTPDKDAALGVNTQGDLARIEELMEKRLLEAWMEKGVRIRNPHTVTIDADVEIGEGTLVQPNTVIEEGSRIGKNCVIGPFARIRGGSRIADGAVIGNFVEVVRSTIGAGTQVKHLSYLGDAKVGAGVNVGCGTITANFDGKAKHATVIRDKARLGSGTVLIAPVTVGRGAVTAAGAVITKGKNVPDGATVAGVPAKLLTKSKKKG